MSVLPAPKVDDLRMVSTTALPPPPPMASASLAPILPLEVHKVAQPTPSADSAAGPSVAAVAERPAEPGKKRRFGRRRKAK